MFTGLDSAYAPTLQQAEYARKQGYRWWGFYLPGVPNTDPLNTWTPEEVSIVRRAGIAPLPICVPSPPQPANPVITAVAAYTSSLDFGLDPTVAICYNGSHIGVSGPVWLPIPTANPPTGVGPLSAIQWGSGDLSGLSVDYNVSSPDFPYQTGIVCDFEYNVTYDSKWYQTFQSTISHLAIGGVPKVGNYILAPTTQGDPTLTMIDGKSGIVVDTTVLGELQQKGFVVLPADHSMIESYKP